MLRGDALVRPRLLERLRQRFQLRVITIAAAAGFGKSTLLAHTVADNQVNPAGTDILVSCEARHNAPSSLLKDLIDGLGATSDEVPTVTDLAEVVWARAPEQVCLLIDDCHRLEPGGPSEGVLARLIEALPANAHLVLAGRRPLPLPIAGLLTKGQADTLDADELRLDAAELAQLAVRLGCPVAELEGSGGWPALTIVRAALGAGAPLEFLDREVLSALPASDRAAFLVLVATGGGDRELVEAACGTGTDLDALGELPLVARTLGGGLRPHDLWADLLAEVLTGEVVQAGRRRVASVLAERGRFGDAFELLVAAQDWDAALPVLFEACNDQQQPPWADVMLRWRMLVPSSLEHHPVVTYLEAMVGRADDPFTARSNAAFRRAIEQFQVSGDVVRELRATVRYAFSCWVRGDRSELAELLERGRTLRTLLGEVIEINLAMTAATIADLDGDSAAVLTNVARLSDVQEPRLAHIAPVLAGFAGLAAGDPGGARAVAELARTRATAVATSAVSGWAMLLPAVTAWAAGDLVAARAALPEDLGPRYNLAERVPALASGAVMRAHLAQLDDAERMVQRIAELVPSFAGRQLLVGFDAVARATIAVTRGDDAGALSILATRLGGGEVGPATAGRAVIWFPAVPWVLWPPSRSLLHGRLSPATARLLAQLEAVRAGDLPTSLPPVGPLVCALPLPWALELTAAAETARIPTARATLLALVALSPTLGRASLEGLLGHPIPGVGRTAAAVLAETPIPPGDAIELHLIGPLTLRRGEQRVDDPNWRRERVRHLLALVALRAGVPRDQVGGLIWPDLDADAMSANLRLTLSYLHGVLEPERQRGQAPWFLRQEGGRLLLSGAPHLLVDLWQLDAALDEAKQARLRSAPEDELRLLLQACLLWTGDLLEGFDAQWVDLPRESLRVRMVAASVRAGELLVAGGDPERAVAVAERALAAEPWSEPTHRVRIAALAAMGEHGAARRAANACRAALAELEVAPDATTARLLARY